MLDPVIILRVLLLVQDPQSPRLSYEGLPLTFGEELPPPPQIYGGFRVLLKFPLFGPQPQ